MAAKLDMAKIRELYDLGVAEDVFLADQWDWYKDRSAESLQGQIDLARERRAWFERKGSKCEHEWIYQAHIDSFQCSIVQRFCIKCGAYHTVALGHEVSYNRWLDEDGKTTKEEYSVR